MGEYIHHIERIELSVTFYVTGTDKISLMNVVNIKWFSEIRVLDTFGNVRSFF